MGHAGPRAAAGESNCAGVIQAINGKAISAFNATTQPDSYIFEIVRKKQKLVVKVPAKKK
jgi:hypothetical protein